MCTINFKTLSINKNNQKESLRSEEREWRTIESGRERAEGEGRGSVMSLFCCHRDSTNLLSTFLCCWSVLLEGKSGGGKNARKREYGIKSERRY
jgi:hypothetical protein